MALSDCRGIPTKSNCQRAGSLFTRSTTSTPFSLRSLMAVGAMVRAISFLSIGMASSKSMTTASAPRCDALSQRCSEVAGTNNKDRNCFMGMQCLRFGSMLQFLEPCYPRPAIFHVCVRLVVVLHALSCQGYSAI